MKRWGRSATLFFLIARGGLAHGDLHERISRLSAEIESAPANAELIFKRAELHRAHEDWKASEADYLRAREIKSDLPALPLGLGRLFLATGRYREAVGEVDKMLAAQPGHVEALVVRARARAGLGRPRDAACDFATAIETCAHPEPEWFLEQSRALVTAGEISRALEVLDEGLARLGNLSTLGLAAAELEVKAQRYDAALARLDRLAASSRRKELWLERRAEILEKAGRPQEALEAYQSARAAIAALPPHLRATKLVVELAHRIDLKVSPAGSGRP